MKRPSYHHGDLANALTNAAIDLARDGGPEAVVLREAARQVGVSATAAYRHFAGHGDLIHAVKERAAGQLAESMRVELARTPPEPDPPAEAVRRLGAYGLAYMQFALAEPGLFRTAFCRPDRTAVPPEGDLDLSMSESYGMLTDCIDDLVSAGAMPEARRPWAEVFAWSSVHGLAMLMLDGPLALCTRGEQEQMMGRILEGVRTSLTAP
jgi:AcrR family transcriptional regulator